MREKLKQESKRTRKKYKVLYEIICSVMNLYILMKICLHFIPYTGTYRKTSVKFNLDPYLH
jgi:hypothetical protein